MSILNDSLKQKWEREEGEAMDGDAKIAAVFYYYLSLDSVPADEKRTHFEALFNIRQSLIWYLFTFGLKDENETVPEDESQLDMYLAGIIKDPEGIENFSIAMPDFDSIKESIINFREETIQGFENEERGLLRKLTC